MGGFFFFQRQHDLLSPLAALGFTASSKNTNDTAQVQYLCHTYNLACTKIQKQGNTITFYVNTSIVYISATKDIKEQLDSLQLTIHALTMEGKEFKGLDFRYDRPVISN